MLKPGLLQAAGLMSCSCLMSSAALAQDVVARGSVTNTLAAGDIIVTANRTASLESKTPVAITALTGATLRNTGVTSAALLGDSVPNLSIDRVNGLQITLRGVTSNDGTEKGDPSAAFLLDGIYIARPQVQDVSFFDIARVEVLRGPQGTLYGRNTTAGVINVISSRPVDRFEASLNGQYGNFGTYVTDAMVNIPVSPALAIRAAAVYDERGSYLHAAPESPYRFHPFKKNASGRLEALLHISDKASLFLKGDYSSLRGDPDITVRSTNFYSLIDPLNPTYIGSSSRAQRTLTYPLLTDSFLHNSTWGVTGEFNWIWDLSR